MQVVARQQPVTEYRPSSHAALRAIGVDRLRRAIRLGEYQAHTVGIARGKLQTNLIVLPRSFAEDFLHYCRRNRKALPLVGIGRAGDPVLSKLGDLDVRTDVPQYDVYRHGSLAVSKSNIIDLWRNDLMAFAIGCSSAFERSLMRKGVDLRHIALDRNVPIYRSSIRTASAGAFGANMAVSMLPIRRSHVDVVRATTAQFPNAHGAPVHVGDPEVIGIHDVQRPDWGEPIEIRGDEVPVFWASSVTGQAALERAGLEMFIANSPGHRLITDVDDQADAGPIRPF